MRILAIPGSVRRDSHNARLLRHAAERAPQGIEIELYTELKSIPPYDEDDDTEPAPVAVAGLRQAVAEADGILIATPEYNSSIPGQLKNALDWVSRPAGRSVARGKPVAVVGASTGMFGAVWAQAEVRKVMGAIGARVLDPDLPVAKADNAFTEDGRLAELELHEQLEEILAELVSLAEQVGEPRRVAA
jgi:chromate reductase, NAD(P)H dehydrogenase (quinone)